MDQILTLSVTTFIILTAIWEVFAGRTRDGRKTRQDWKVAFLATFMMVAIQRPLVLLLITLGLTRLFPGSAGSLAWLEVLRSFCTAHFTCLPTAAAQRTGCCSGSRRSTR